MGEKYLKVKLRNLVVLLLLILLFLISACSGIQEANNYPLKVDDGSSGEVGNKRSNAGDSWSMSILYITNEGDKPITLKSVSLTDMKDMSIIETSLMKIGDEKTLLGVQKWPLVSTKDFPNFDTRIPVEGAVIEPGDGYNLIVAVEALADTASASALEIVYKDENGKQYMQKSHYTYTLSNDDLK